MKLLYFIFTFYIGFLTNINGHRILGVFPRYSRGDFILFEQLMRSLADRGHEVNVISHFPLDQVHKNYYDIIQLPDGMPSLYNNITYQQIGNKIRYLLNMINTEHGNDICHILSHSNVLNILKNPPQNNSYNVIVTEMFIANCFTVFGNMLKIPVVGVSTYGRLPWVYDIVNNPEGLDFVPEQPFTANHINFIDRFVNFVSRTYIKWSFYRRTQSQDIILKKYIDKNAPSVRQLESNVALVLTNGHVLTHGPRPITPNLVEVGAMHIVNKYNPPLYEDIQKWLDASIEGVIYLNLGMDFKFDSFPIETIETFYKSFKKLSPMRVLMRIAKFSNLPPGLPENVLIVPWVQQLRVLAHPKVRAFISHGGIMGLQEAIYAAVPVIGIPLWGDQFDNIDMLVKKNIGIKLNYDSINENILDMALQYILKNTTVRESASAFSLAYFDRPVTPIDTACYWIEYVIRHGGDMLRLPQAKLTWWQYFNVDVFIIFFIISFLLVLTLLLIIRKIIIKIISRFRRKPKYHKLL